MSLLRAKLTPPVVNKTVLRKRLFERLDSARDYPLIWLSAPAGAGKTTLVASYLEAKNHNSLWYQVDEGDADMATFFHYFGQMIKNHSRSHKKLPALTPEYQQGLSEFSQNYFTEAFQRLDAPTLLVLDNFQDAGSEAELYCMLVNAINDTPKGITIIVISRTDPPAIFARLIANQKLTLIDWNDLRFTVDETLSISQLLYPEYQITSQQIQVLSDHIQGWVTGLILLLEQGVAHDAIEFCHVSENREYLFDYFYSEIFNKLDTPTQLFLLKTALLPKMTVSICKQLTGNTASKKILSQLVRKQTFTVRYGLLKPSYEYHPLFREFLHNHASEYFNQGEYKQLQSQAGLLLANAGSIDAAVELLIQSENWPTLAKLIIQHAKKQIEQGRNRQLSRWIKALPGQTIKQHPWLLYWQGMTYLQYENGAARDTFKQAYQLFQHEKNVLGLYMSWCGIADSYTFAHETFCGAEYWIKQLAWLQQTYPKPPTMEARGHLIFSAGQLIFWVQPNHPALPEWMAKMETIYRFVPSKFLVVMSSMQLSIYYGQIGETSRVHNISKRLEKLSISVDDNLLLKALLLMTSYANDWMTASFELSYEFIDDSRQKLKDEGVKIFEGLMLAHALYHSACKHDLLRMKALLDLYGEVVNNESLLDQGHYQLHLGYYQALSGNFEHAISHAKIAVELVDQTCAPLPIWVSHSMLSYIYIESEQFTLATKHLEQVRNIVDEIKTCAASWVYHMICSYLAFRQNKLTLTLKHLKICFQLGREKNMKASAIWPPSMVSTLCSLALEHDIEPDYARGLIDIYHYTPQNALHICEQWPWPIKIHTMGGFRVLLYNREVNTESRPFDLLKALLAFDGRDVHIDNIMDALWPDADGDQARSSFKTSLHRLRKNLGDHDALLLKNNRLSLNEHYVWLDSWRIKRLFAQAEQLNLTAKPAQTAHASAVFGQLMQLYQGHFLSSEGASWTILQREELHSRFIRHTTTLAQIIEQEDIKTAIQCYQRLLEINPTAETAYQGLIHCYQSQGQHGEASACYEKFAEILTATTGEAPSPTTKELIKASTQDL